MRGPQVGPPCRCDFVSRVPTKGALVGLALALALHKAGCKDVIIVDAVEQGENTSRAIAIHAATLEVCSRTADLVLGTDFVIPIC